jgi:H/ACA ribonucleoprotein complex subunit 4
MKIAPPWMMKQEMVIRDEDVTDPSYGCPPLQRPITQYLQYGIINLDKPSGPSSHEVVAWAKRKLELKHAGHGGTLEDFKPGRSQGYRRASAYT